MSTTVTTPNELEIRVERLFDAPHARTPSGRIRRSSPTGGATAPSSRRWTSAPGGTWRFRTAYGVVEGEYREVEPPERLVQTFQKPADARVRGSRRADEARPDDAFRDDRGARHDMNYGVEEGAKQGFARIDAVLEKITA